jgi:hypothetical protein
MIPIMSPAPRFAAIERDNVEYDFGHPAGHVHA